MRRLEAGDAGCDFLSAQGAEQAEFLKNDAMRVEQSDYGRAYVLPGPDGQPPILGFYVVCMGRLQTSELPEAERDAAPARTMPVALLAQLARDDRAEKGIGERLIADALRRILAVANEIGCAGTMLHTANDRLIRYYERFGFQVVGSRSNPRKTMFLGIKHIRATLANASTIPEGAN